MAAGENQPQTIDGDLRGGVIGFFALADETRSSVRSQLFLKAALTTDAVYGLVAGRLDNPGAGNIGHARFAPLVHRARESFLRALFGQVKVANESNQCGYNATPVGAVDSFNGGGCILGHA